MKQSIGTKVKALRLQKKISQNNLCGELMSRSILSRIENGKMEPSITQIVYLSNKLDAPISLFFNDINYNENVKERSSFTDLKIQRLFNNNSFYEVIQYYEYSTDDFKQIDDFNKYYYLGISYYNQNIYKESIKPLKKYINEYEKSKKEVQKQYVINLGNALNTLCKIILINHNYEKAKHYLYMAIKYLSEYGAFNSLIYFITHNNLVYIYNHTFQYHKAINLVEGFLKANDVLSYRIITPQLHIAPNVAYFNIENYSKAIEHIKKGILLLSYENDKHEVGRCYINYINSLRYSLMFTEAFEIVENCKKEYIDNKSLYLKFLMQEMTLYFNIEEYDKVLELADNINFKGLQKMSKNNYRFMLGYTCFLNKNFDKAYNFLTKCEKYYIERNYNYDLVVLYEHLYRITKDKIYIEKSRNYDNSIGRKNIFIK